MDSVVLEGPDGRRIEAKRIRNPRLEIDTWAFDCPGCREWGIIYGYRWELDEEDRLTVGRKLTCRSPRCDAVFHVKQGQVTLLS